VRWSGVWGKMRTEMETSVERSFLSRRGKGITLKEGAREKGRKGGRGR